MKFEEAVKEAEKGTDMRRPTWNTGIVMRVSSIEELIVIRKLKGTSFNLTMRDLKATDWIPASDFCLSDCVQVGGVGHELYFETDIKNTVKQIRTMLGSAIPIEMRDKIDKLLGKRFILI